MPKISMIARTVAFLLLFSTPLAWAECSRDDIQFYLDKGFTTEQVTSLCSEPAGEKKKKYRAYTDEYVDRSDQEYQARMRVEREAALRNAIEATDIRLERGYLYYVRPQCVSEGVEKDRAFGLKSCPNIRYRIKLAGLKVDEKEHKKRFLFGQKMVRVTGQIKRQEMPGAFADIPDEYWRNVLRKRLEKGNSTKIPLRDGVDFHFARNALRDMVGFETERAQQLAGHRSGAEEDGVFDDLGEMLESGAERESEGGSDQPANEGESAAEEEGLFDVLDEMFN
ncbi:MAG: hypothetical protein OXJ38_03480 [Gammaproteobacteria bacterium]|nr:hypothetical protein [Gammaproteobacteria bacterium]